MEISVESDPIGIRSQRKKGGGYQFCLGENGDEEMSDRLKKLCYRLKETRAKRVIWGELKANTQSEGFEMRKESSHLFGPSPYFGPDLKINNANQTYKLLTEDRVFPSNWVSINIKQPLSLTQM